jgi:cytochrome P450
LLTHNSNCITYIFLSIGLSRSELLDEMRLFLLAGFETTSTALAWFIHLMSKHPQVQQKIKAELASENCQGNLSLDRLDSLIYLDCVIKEVFRFCPPINGTVRTLTVDDRLPASGAQLFRGDQILIPFHSLARDTRYWSIDPELFYPERFLDADKNHHPYALIPFGAGHRQCIGQDLARFELKVIAATLMQHVTFGDGGCQVNSGGHLSKLTIMPKNVGVTIEFDK